MGMEAKFGFKNSSPHVTASQFSLNANSIESFFYLYFKRRFDDVNHVIASGSAWLQYLVPRLTQPSQPVADDTILIII